MCFVVDDDVYGESSSVKIRLMMRAVLDRELELELKLKDLVDISLHSTYRCLKRERRRGAWGVVPPVHLLAILSLLVPMYSDKLN
jgi:hypothetical protein